MRKQRGAAKNERAEQPAARPGPRPAPAADRRPQVIQSRLRRFLIAVLFLAALGIRLYGITQPPLEFHATRQYRSALIARAYYYQAVDSIPEWKRRIAAIWKNREGVLEPPVMELLAGASYRLVGGEHLWIPRLASSVFWLVGGVFLYLLAVRLSGTDAALVAVAFYLLLNYAVLASRSFQPEPLMIALFLCSIWLIARYFDNPSAGALSLAGTAAAVSMFVKPVCLFPILGAFVSLALTQWGLRRLLTRRHLYLFVAGSLLPSMVFYVYGIFVAGFLRGQASGSILPHLLLDSDFWANWERMVRFVVGYTAFSGALLGACMFRAGFERAVVVGLWIGYFALGVVFTYHIATHGYYHLVLIPLIGVSLGPIGAAIIRRLRETCERWYWRTAVVGVIVFAMFLWTQRAPWRVHRRGADRIVAAARAIGEAVDHSERTVFLAREYGKPLGYHAEIAGVSWPSTAELRAQKMRGRPELSAEERFERIKQRVSPEYFIITDLVELRAQRDLWQFLAGRFPVVERTEDYLIFDLSG